MIPYFRKIRKKLAENNRPMKYLRYAIGEIVLVVVGILIALQINNWNQERIQKEELEGLLQSIASGVKSDVRTLNLLSTARENIVVMTDSIYGTYIARDIDSISPIEAAYVNSAFGDINNSVYFNPNLSAFQSLQNSTYIGKLQGTDLALLLNTYYTNAEKIQNIEEEYNQHISNLIQDWRGHFRDKDARVFERPWSFFEDFTSVRTRYLEILKDDHTLNILRYAFFEGSLIRLYEEQILMGNKLISMVKNSNYTFDQQTKLDFSGILFSFGDADLVSILIDGEVPTEFELRYASSGLGAGHFSKKKDYWVMTYPENTYSWGFPYFIVNALKGRVHEMDFSDYKKLLIEMRGETGAEEFELVMKDKNDPPDGSESRVRLEVTDEWKVYEIETSQFVTADMETIMVPLGFVFEGPVGQVIHVRSVQFKKD